MLIAFTLRAFVLVCSIVYTYSYLVLLDSRRLGDSTSLCLTKSLYPRHSTIYASLMIEVGSSNVQYVAKWMNRSFASLRGTQLREKQSHAGKLGKLIQFFRSVLSISSSFLLLFLQKGHVHPFIVYLLSQIDISGCEDSEDDR